MTAERLSAHQLLSELVRVIRKPVAGRATLDEANPVNWDNTPTFYQATEIAHGHILQFRQVWKADGYSLGDLLHSIPLAPCQKKQIVTIDWDRREDAVRTEDLTEREFLFANLVRDRDVKEMMDTALQRGDRWWINGKDIRRWRRTWVCYWTPCDWRWWRRVRRRFRSLAELFEKKSVRKQCTS